ncbi:MAG: S9 family peptidase [Acidobacteria bacterium]|nr:S9 family peptidase [Acidobacteriota bacterium]
MTHRLIALVVVLPTVVAAQSSTPGRLSYPPAKSVDVVEDYFGTRIADPYRWLENPDSPDTKAWVEAQNKVTFGFLGAIPARDRIRSRLKDLWNYERYGAPQRAGKSYVYSHNNGLQNQSVLFKTPSLDRNGNVLLDPNTLSEKGTVALSGLEFSDDGRVLAYATSASGSDWMEWKVREVETGRDRPDFVKWSKFSGAAWLKDGSGFFYCRYPEPKPGHLLDAVNENHTLYFHRIGTPQNQDRVVYARPDKPDWLFESQVTEDGRWLVVSQFEGTEPKNRVFVKELSTPSATLEPFLDLFDAEYSVVGNDADLFYIATDAGAPRKRLVAINRRRPERAGWKTLIPEGPGRDVLASVSMIGNRFIAIWRTDAHEVMKIYGLDGTFQKEIPLPGLGTIAALSGKRRDAEAFFTFTSFIFPTTAYRYDFASGETKVFRQPKVAFRPEDYETVQVFYRSKDGTRIPMFLTSRKGMKRDGRNPTLLYGYGGFDISLTPTFSPGNVAWLEMGGIYAVANLRGGGEYGREWHDAGRLKNKQNVFDDFIAAAEYLIAEQYTSTPKLAINGGSNGGLLVGACVTQRPDLFGAAVAQVGVMDMLRFHKFTIGKAWASDYGSADTKEGFDTLIKYSPLHNIKRGVKYPATLVITADHDDRVVPAHSHKFTATLQAAQAGDAPILARIETEAGHGAGTALDKTREERTDIWAFLAQVLQIRD